MNKSVPAATTPAVPAYLVHVLERGAMLMQAQWPRTTAVRFTWWADGEEHAFMAVLDWPRCTDSPRLIVSDGRSGDFRCQSLEGRPFEIDREHVELDVPPDDVARYEWNRDHHGSRYGARPGPASAAGRIVSERTSAHEAAR